MTLKTYERTQSESFARLNNSCLLLTGLIRDIEHTKWYNGIRVSEHSRMLQLKPRCMEP